MKLLLSLLTVVAITVTGCLQSFTTISVHRNGTGHVVDTMLVSSFLYEMMSSLSSVGDSGAATTPTLPWSDSTIREKGSALGPGVVLESWNLIEQDGMKGYVATYFVQNINAISVKRDRSMDGAGFSDDEESTKTKPDPITFRYENNTVVINNPDPTPKNTSSSKEKGNDLRSTLSMMSTMLHNMRTNIRVAVDGPIISTNAEHAQGNMIMLMAVDFDKLVSAWQKDTALMASFEDVKNGDLQALRKTISKYPAGALVMDFNKEIKITF